MGARKPQRPAPGHAMLLPHVGDSQSQRAFQAVQTAAALAQRTAGNLAGAVASIASGRMLAAPVQLTGAGSGTLPTGTCVVVLEGIGGGGGGGGAKGNASVAAAAGGSSGVRLRTTIG